VGCVITDANGQVLGEGFTQRTGGPHAEVMALRDLLARGNSAAGATAYVTLEPCSHHGRTGPCCDALIAAGIKKVVASVADPNPLVSGQGFEKLREAGVLVEIGPGAEASRELNMGFFSRMSRNKPWVRMKIAASLDGRTALTNGTSKWITSPQARADGHAWRAKACTVLTGIGTVLADDPSLDVRLVDTIRQPRIAIVDSRLETPLNAKVLEGARDVFIYTASSDDTKAAELSSRGVTVIYCPATQYEKRNRVDLHAMLRDMAERETNEVHVEAGQRLNGSLLEAGLVDELLIYLAPKLLGSGRGMAEIGLLADLAGAISLDFGAIARVGPDVRILARPHANTDSPSTDIE
jgi:diaminohydroxyphosphoribosylaminopyrimidine deaminase/5-amino-6-(5-phosphoribosylamino)uracil reductase